MTEWFVTAAAIAVILWVGWTISRDTVITIVQVGNRAAIAEQRAAQCEAQKK